MNTDNQPAPELDETQDIYGSEPSANEPDPITSATKDAPNGAPSVDDQVSDDTPATSAAPAQPATVKLDPESLAQLRQTYQPQPQPNQQPRQQQLTPEQVNKYFAPYKVTKQSLERLGFEEPTDEQVAVMNELVKGSVTQAVTTMNTIMQARMSQINEQLSPIQQHFQQQEQQRQVQSFYQSYPGLQGHERVVQLAAQQVQTHNPDGSERTLAEVQKDIVTNSQQILKELGRQIDPTKAATSNAPSNAPAQGVTPVPHMARTQGGGRSQGNRPKPSTNPDADIYS